MEKRTSGSNLVQEKTTAVSADQKLNKIKEALKGVDWNYEAIVEDLTGFIEDHEVNAHKLKNTEAEKQKLGGELTKSEQKIQFLNKKIQESQNEINYVKRGYQQRVDELLSVKNEMNQKFEVMSQKKLHSDEKLKEISEVLRKKEDELAKLKLLSDKAEIQIKELTGSFADKLQKFKSQISEKVDGKEKLFVAKSNRIISEKEQLQKYVTELMADNHRSSQEVQNLKKSLSEAVQSKDHLVNQKNILVKKSEDLEKNLNLTSNQLLALENEVRGTKKVSVEKESFVSQLKQSLVEHKNLISKFEQDRIVNQKKISELNKALDLKSIHIQDLQTTITDLTEKLNNIDTAHLEKDKNKDLVAKLQSDILGYTEQIAEMKKQNSVHLEELVAKHNVIKSLDLENSTIIQKYNSVISEHEAHIQKLITQRTELQETVRAVSNEYAVSQENIKNLEDLNTKLRHASHEGQEIHATTKKQNESLLLDLDKANAEKKETHKIYNQVKRELNDFKEKVIQRAVEVSELESLNQKITTERDGLKFELQMIKDELSGSEVKIGESQDKISNLNAEIESLSLQLNTNKEKMGILEGELDIALTQLDEHKAMVSDAKGTIVALESKLGDRVDFERKNLDQKQDLEDQKDILNSKIEDLKFELSEREQDMIQKQKMIDDIILERKSYAQRNEDLTDEITSLNIKLETVKNNLVNEVKKVQGLEDELKNKIVEIGAIKSSMQILSLKYSETEELNQQLQREKDKFNFEVEEIQSAYEELKENLKIKKVEFAEELIQKDDEIYNLKSEKQNFLDQELNLVSKVKAKELELEDSVGTNGKLLTKIAGLEEQIQLQQNEILNGNSNEQQLLEKIKTFELQLADYSYKIVKSSENFDNLYQQKQLLDKQAEENKILYDLVKKKGLELEVSIKSLNKREEQLNLYSRWVDSQKEGIQKQVYKLASEIKTTKELNPLNPYLKITEREISKIEVLMTKSNVFGPQRLQLENQYEQLIKQRDEVKELLNRTNIEVDQKAYVLMNVLKSSEFIPVPPLPPGKVVESETDLNI